MSNSTRLRKTRANTVINQESKVQEIQMQDVTGQVIDALCKEYGLSLKLNKRFMLHDITAIMKRYEPDEEYANVKKTTYLKPDGGIVSLVDTNGNLYPILIGEVKRQGTNDKREAEGKDKQSQGNAVERLAKNVIGVECAMSHENFKPFISFGEGCDFAEGSTILDRVHTIARFRPINRLDLYHPRSQGSFFFREEPWSAEEMYQLMYEVASSGIKYYIQKYGKIFV